jgi:hypothetical protein
MYLLALLLVHLLIGKLGEIRQVPVEGAVSANNV